MVNFSVSAGSSDTNEQENGRFGNFDWNRFICADTCYACVLFWTVLATQPHSRESGCQCTGTQGTTLLLRTRLLSIMANLQASLVLDLAQALKFIHESALLCHGDLRTDRCILDGRFRLRLAITQLPTHRSLKSSQQASYAASTASKPKEASVNSKTDDDSRKAPHAGESLAAVWMAPELITGAAKRATPESDVFSFSIIVHEITFQKGPYGFMEQVRMPLVLPMQIAPRAIPTGGRQDFQFLVELGVEDRWRHQHPGHDGHHHVSGETRWRQPGPTGCPAKGLPHRRAAHSAVFGELADSTWLVVGSLSGASFR